MTRPHQNPFPISYNSFSLHRDQLPSDNTGASGAGASATQKFRLAALYIAAALLFLATEMAVANDLVARSYTGVAFGLEDGRPVYTEKHVEKFDGNGEEISSRVRYYSPEGQLFAEKRVDYEGRPFLPSLSFTDFRDQSRMVVSEREGAIWVTVDDETPVAVDIADASYTPVVDSGFDNLVQDRWWNLKSGETVRFSFLAVTRQQWFNFRMRPVAMNRQVIRLVIEPDSFFLRLLVDPIELAYDMRKRRLVSYAGLTNIPEDSDRNHEARIRYQYNDESINAGAQEADKQWSVAGLQPAASASSSDL